MDPTEDRQQALAQKKRVFQLFAQILELPPQDRPSFLDQACSEDRTLRRQLESLLAADQPIEDNPGLLARPVFDVHAEDPSIGRSIGNYRLVRLLDRGGMGAVYLAERQDLDQQVALKLIRRGLDLDDVLVRRFHNERQILANLTHQNIARFLDGGTTADRRPYFVMEYVEGQPIDSYARDQGLTIEERLELFREVCSAVQFAHQNLVIHRDLKPGNILITAAGEPKLLDFGIAKLLDEGTKQKGVITTSGQGPMTPRYASPEQIKNEPVTTASDVYSLGVLLYELLTGLDPYAVDNDSGYELSKAICELPPTKPSTAVRRRAAEDVATSPAQAQHHLDRRLAGDLDSIVLKALDKNPQMRYGSAEQLSADLLRHLRSQPVEARAGNFWYRAQRFVARHLVALSIALAFVLLLTGSVIVSTVLWRQAVAQQKQAEKERQGTQAAYELLRGFLKIAEPDQASGEVWTPLEILERGKTQLEREDLEPELRIEVAGTLAEIFRNLSSYDQSRKLMQMALDTARQYHQGDHPEIAKRLANLAVLLYDFEDYKEAESRFREALVMFERLDQPAEVLRIESNLAAVLLRQGNLEEAATLYRSLLDTRINRYATKFGGDDKDIATSRRNLAAVYYAQRRFKEAEEELQQALYARRQFFGPEHTAVASVLDLLGRVLAADGRAEEAESLLDEALAIRLKILGPDHLAVARSKAQLAAVLVESAPETAHLLLSQALQVFYQADPVGSDTAETESLLGAALIGLGRSADGKICLVAGYEELKELRGSQNIRTELALERLQAFESTTSARD